jgi:putative SOS response-associated peptidase YedK
MCGRYTLRSSMHSIAEVFRLAEVPDLAPRYNIAPTQKVLTIVAGPESGSRQARLLRWGLVPSWADDPSIGNRMLNARGETVDSKPAFRKAFTDRRCVVVADGFYEWRKSGKFRQPFFIRRPNDAPLAFAGLFEHWSRGTDVVDSCTIITTHANAFMSSLHDRMPVILSPEGCARWLDPEFRDRAALKELIVPLGDDELIRHQVSTVVNRPTIDDASCIVAVEAAAAEIAASPPPVKKPLAKQQGDVKPTERLLF